MLSIESKEAAISDLREVIIKFDKFMQYSNLFNDITSNSHTNFQLDSFHENNSDEEKLSYNNEKLNILEIVAKFKNQDKQYEKQNQFLKSKLDSFQMQNLSQQTLKNNYNNNDVCY